MLDCVGFTFARICGILEINRNINGLLCVLAMTVLSLYMPYCDPRPSCRKYPMPVERRNKRPILARAQPLKIDHF
jgi:hypothetical protein